MSDKVNEIHLLYRRDKVQSKPLSRILAMYTWNPGARQKTKCNIVLSHLKTGYLSSIGFSLEELFQDYLH